MTGPFRNNNPFAVLFLLFYGLLLRFGTFAASTPAIRSEADGWLYERVFGWAFNPSVAPSLIAALLTVVQALSINVIVNREKLLGRPNHLPGMAHLILSSLFPEWWGLSSAMVANTLLVPVLGCLNGLFNNQRPGKDLFNAGLLIGMAGLFHKPALWLILLVFAALFTMGARRTSDWLVALFGLAIPFYFLLAGLYLFDRWVETASLLPHSGIHLPRVKGSALPFHAGSGYMVLMLLFGIWQIQTQVQRMLIRNRKVWNVLAFYLFLAIAIPFLTEPGDIASRLLLAPPLAVFHASGYQHSKPRWLPEALHVAALALVALANLRAIQA